MDRTRRLSEEIMQRHREVFGPDFEANKKALEDLALIPSKQLRNRIAGYISRALKENTADSEQSPDETPVE